MLAGNQNTAARCRLMPQRFRDTVGSTRRFYQLCLVDCGTEIETDFFKAILSVSDALMIVGSCGVDGGLAVEQTVIWLAARRRARTAQALGHRAQRRQRQLGQDFVRPISARRWATGCARCTPCRGIRTCAMVPTLISRRLRKATRLAFDGTGRRPGPRLPDRGGADTVTVARHREAAICARPRPHRRCRIG